MKTFTATTKSGNRVRLYSDDTFTLAIGSPKTDSEETTPELLAEIFSLRQLVRLAEKEPSSKIYRAIIASAQSEI